MLAFKALNSNVGAEPDYLPLVTAARVLLLEANHISQLYLHNHSFYPIGLLFGYDVRVDRQSLIWSRSLEAACRAA